MRIGAHVPTRGRGPLGAIESARACGAEAVQIFVSNPRGWAPPRIGEREATGFREQFAAARLGPLFAHAPYLTNVASPNPGFLTRTRELLVRSAEACEAIGADGLVVHAGAGGPGEAAGALERAAETLRLVCAEVEGCDVVVELTASTAGSVAARIGEAAALFDAAGRPEPLRLCLDTCHLFVSGYALDEPEGVAACFEELNAAGLADRLALIHANDAKHPRGSSRDRHEHIGHGHIGTEGFRAILARPELAGIGVVVETPGRLEDHARNIDVLRRLAGGPAETPQARGLHAGRPHRRSGA